MEDSEEATGRELLKCPSRIRAITIDDEEIWHWRLRDAARTHLPGIKFFPEKFELVQHPSGGRPIAKGFLVSAMDPQVRDTILLKKPHLIFVDISASTMEPDASGRGIFSILDDIRSSLKQNQRKADEINWWSNFPVICVVSAHIRSRSEPSTAVVAEFATHGGCSTPVEYFPKSEIRIDRSNPNARWQKIWSALSLLRNINLGKSDGQVCLDNICYFFRNSDKTVAKRTDGSDLELRQRKAIDKLSDFDIVTNLVPFVTGAHLAINLMTIVGAPTTIGSRLELNFGKEVRSPQISIPDYSDLRERAKAAAAVWGVAAFAGEEDPRWPDFSNAGSK